MISEELGATRLDSNVGRFSQGGAVPSIRALGSLFPEPMHIVVSAGSRIRTVADLRGKRVAIGARDSGTRADALAILGAHGLTEKDLAEVSDDGVEAAAARLRAGAIDAFFATIGAPALLVTHADLTDAEVAVVLGLVFESADSLAAGSAQGSKISGLRGITVPLHPAASRYFGPAAPSPAPASPPKGEGKG